MEVDTQVTMNEEDDDDFLRALIDGDDEDDDEVQEEVEQRYAKNDEKLLKSVKRQQEVLVKHIEEERTEKLLEQFEGSADETAREWFAVMRTGKEDYKQLKGLMTLAKQKSQALADKNAAPVEELAKEQAKKIAAEEWGAGPLVGGADTSQKDAEEEQMKRIANGDIHALAEAIFTPPPVPRR